MRVVPRPTKFELGAVRTPAGERQIVFRMVAGNEELVGTPTDDELRWLRQAIGESLNEPKTARMASFPSRVSDDTQRRRLRKLWTPS